MTISALKSRTTKASVTKPSPAASATFAKALSKTSAKAAAGVTPKIARKTPPKPAVKVAAGTTTAIKPTAKTLDAKPDLASRAQPVVLGPEMRKKELIDRVVSRSGIKKKDAKPVVEAMLAVLGEALADCRELILPPLGKLKVRREKKLPNGLAMVVKVRQNNKKAPIFPTTDD
ncbi:MAG: HU family DNA-binding protein [Sulfitobacter sp.]